MASILLIDDLEEVQRYLSRMIGDLGCAVLTASDGETGVELAKDPDVRLILTDLMMPGEVREMDLVRKLRALRPDCPIIVCSGFPTQERIQECEELGITDFISKPFEMAYIKPIIKRLLATNAELSPDG